MNNKSFFSKKIPEQFKKYLGEDTNELKEKLKEYFEQYSAPIFFAAGFLFDVATLDRLDNLFNFLFQAFYLIIGYLSYFLSITPDNSKVKSKYIQFFYHHADDIHHFSIGSLLSAYALYFFKSASLSTSYFFLLFMFALLFLNELKRFQSLGPWIKTGLLKLCLISFCCAYIPILIGHSGALSFALAIITSALVSALLGYYLSRYHIEWLSFKKSFIIPKVLTIALFVLLYLFRVLPPLPLALKFAGIYYDVSKENEHYIVSTNSPVWKFWKNGDQDFLARPGDKVYVFIRLFAPGGLSQKVRLVFEKKIQGDWHVSDRIPINITGGREQGFRGVAYKKNYSEGNWRVLIETDEGFEIGRLNFNITLDESSTERSWRKVIH